MGSSDWNKDLEKLSDAQLQYCSNDVIYLHQIIRLTMALWKDETLDKDSFGVLQVFLHNELKQILNYLFDQKQILYFLQ